jgi:predicted transposase YdaD
MPEDPIHQPHDKLFKQGFCDPVNAAGFLRHQFPPEITEQIDWEHLTLQSGTFIDSHYRSSEGDLLFGTRLGERECFVYLLFEHQIAEDPMIALRLLRYMVRIWEAFHKGSPSAPLPIILPVVLAQNKKAWKVSPKFSTLLDLPTGLHEYIRPFLPDFRFQLVQLSEMPYEAIRGTPAGIFLLRVMKAERSGQLLGDAVWDESLMSQIPEMIFEMVIHYLLNAEIDSERFESRLRKVSQSNLKKSAMTLAQQLTQKGLEKGRLEGTQKGLEKGRLEGTQKGLERGRQEGLQEAILETLSIRFGSTPTGLVEAIRNVEDEKLLRSLHRASLQVDSLEAFGRHL